MDPEKMRHCVSLGYSAKSKMADTIGQCKFSLLFFHTLLLRAHTHTHCYTYLFHYPYVCTPHTLHLQTYLLMHDETLSYFLIVLDLLFELYVSDGNGFKTSTMRLGADVIVFSRCRGKNGLRFAFSIKYQVAFDF